MMTSVMLVGILNLSKHETRRIHQLTFGHFWKRSMTFSTVDLKTIPAIQTKASSVTLQSALTEPCPLASSSFIRTILILHHRIVFLPLVLPLPLYLLLRNVVVLWGWPSRGRRNRPGSRAFLPSKDAKAAAYEQEYRSAGDGTD